MRGARWFVISAILVAVTAGPRGVAAVGPKALDGSYFFGSCSSCVHGSATIAGQTIRGTAIILATDNSGEQISLNARRLPTYTAVTFLLGCDDTDSQVGASVVLEVRGDGQAPLGRYTVTQGQPARQVIVPFKGHGAIAFVTKTAANYKACYVTLATPLAIVLAGASPAALTVVPARGAVGTHETLSVAAPAGTQASAVITYASGQQQLVGPTLVGADGRATLRFTVAPGARGMARVTVVTATKVLAATFAVTT